MGGSWIDRGHVASNPATNPGLDATRMNSILLKFRPIAPKPIPENGVVASTSDSFNGSSHGSPHAKIIGKWRRKSVNKETNGNIKKDGRKRKSSSADQTAENCGDHVDDQQAVTLLPLFPETPDPSPRHEHTDKMPIWLDFNRSNPVFGDNYKICHEKGW